LRTSRSPGRAAGEGPRGVVFMAPATAQFDQETLSLDGSSFSWSGGRNPPDRFTLLATPTIPLTAGTPVTLSSSVTVQYLERLPDGTMKVCEIPRDSPEAPHFRLTFSVAPAAGAGGEPALSCELDIATVASREGVAGVALEVGKPVLARHQEMLHPVVRTGDWSALVCQAPNGSDYSMLVLLKVTPGSPPVAAGPPTPGSAPVTPETLDDFVSHYYLHPRPECIGAAIDSFGRSGFAGGRADVFVGFLTEVLAANPARVPEWEALIDRQPHEAREVLAAALSKSRPQAAVPAEAGTPGAIPAAKPGSSSDRAAAPADLFPAVSGQNAGYWGAFYASGKTEYLRKLVDQLTKTDEHYHAERYWEGATAMWSLAQNAREQPAVRAALQAMMPQLRMRVRNLVQEVLMDPPNVLLQRLLSSRFGPPAPRGTRRPGEMPPADIDSPASSETAETPVRPYNYRP